MQDHQRESNVYELVSFPLYKYPSNWWDRTKLTITEDDSKIPRMSTSFTCEENRTSAYTYLTWKSLFFCDETRTIYVPVGTIQKSFSW